MKGDRAGPVAYLSLVLAAFLWGSSFIALKYSFQYYDGLFVIFGRMVAASLVFLPLLPLCWRFKYRRGDIRSILLMVLFEPCLYFVAEAAALERTTASQAGMITALLPVMVAVAAAWLLGERISRRTILGFSAAISGAVLLSLRNEPSGYAPNPPLGNFLEFLAMICAVGYVIQVKRLTARYHPFLLTAFQAFGGVLFFGLLMLTPLGHWPHELHAGASLAVVYLGIVVTLGAYGLYNMAISRVPATRASVFINLIPLFTLLLGALLLGERLGPLQGIAAALILGGVFLAQDRRTARRTVESGPAIG